MMITTKGRNALKLMIDLADHYGEGYISLADIAERQKESVKYLEYTASQLSSSGLIVSARGKAGGYRLSRAPEEYTAAEILLSGEGSLAPVHCLEVGAVPCENAASCVTLPLFKELDDVIMNFLNSKTLADLIKPDESKAQ
ncbi:MAG: Rrf2 family transcriptional regulator [Clostridia bacterium]|nr:Rrf2 family transcriptional regulator [Clostridia bacterium]